MRAKFKPRTGFPMVLQVDRRILSTTGGNENSYNNMLRINWL